MRQDVRQAGWSVYVLFSTSLKRTYVGCAHDVPARLAQHNAGRVRATRARVPWRLLHVEPAGDYPTAIARERYFKTGAGRRRLVQLCQNDCPPG